MKTLNWLLYIAIIGVTGILIGFTHYTTDTPPKNWDASQSAPQATSGTVESSRCSCCAKRKARQQERIKRARARQHASELDTKTSSP